MALSAGGMGVWRLFTRVTLLFCISLSFKVSIIIAGTCRKDPAAASEHCGLPYELSNFQGMYASRLSASLHAAAIAVSVVHF